MKAFRITLLILALSALVLFLAWAKGWVGHLQDTEQEIEIISRDDVVPGDFAKYKVKGRWQVIQLCHDGTWIERNDIKIP